MAKIKTFFHFGKYEPLEVIYSGMYSKKVEGIEQRNSEVIKRNTNLSNRNDDEINEFIKDKKVISITTTLQIKTAHRSSATEGYVTTVLYEDE